MTTKKKTLPQRMCVGCRQMKDKKQLIRVVRTTNEEIVIDPTGKLSGRGAYICPNADCLAKAKKYKSLDKALKTSIEPAVMEKLEAQLLENGK